MRMRVHTGFGLDQSLLACLGWWRDPEVLHLENLRLGFVDTSRLLDLLVGQGTLLAAGI